MFFPADLSFFMDEREVLAKKENNAGLHYG